MSFKFLVSLAVYSAILSIVGNLVNTEVPEAYMDEIFHIPQAQVYCGGNFTHWDNKITTLPGLYLFSVGIIQPLNSITKLVTNEPPDPLKTCSTLHLRSLNILCGLTNLVLIYSITVQLHGEKQDFTSDLALLSSWNISLLPVLFMFNFLYYTDALSTTMVLLTYSLHLAGKNGLAALAGLCSVLCRQTNIVWVFLTAGITAGNTLITELSIHQAKTKHPVIALTTAGQVKELIQGSWTLLQSPWRAARIVGLIVINCFWYIQLGLAFLLFVRWNGGIVVGDRSAHQAVVHVPQLFYFGAFFSALAWPHCLAHLPQFTRWLLSCRRSTLAWLVAAAAGMGLAIAVNTQAHPYLLADNRHFTFYIWRRLFMRHWSVKYLLVPGYLLSLWNLGMAMKRSELMFKLLFPLCLVLSLVPQQLLEFRYFILPFILARVQVKPSAGRLLLLELASLLLVNLGVLLLFLYRPFTWDSQPGVSQRFMW